MNEITLPEVVAAGIYDTRDTVRGREVTRARKTVMFELELVDGAGGIAYIDRESVPITERLFVCSKPGESRHTRLPYRCHYVHFMLSGGPLYEALMAVPHFLSRASMPNTARSLRGSAVLRAPGSSATA